MFNFYPWNKYFKEIHSHNSLINNPLKTNSSQFFLLNFLAQPYK